ncbi:MAG: hypothetical protein K2X47_05545 [Bdellovibrionales bacterium]|nr:hypothetical protein [Bdellovibrionales bacterium]
MGARWTLWKTHLVLTGTGFLVLGFGLVGSQFLSKNPYPSSLPLSLATPKSESAAICRDFYQTVCEFESRKDPTGRVPQRYEGEVKVLRRFERLNRDYPEMSRDQIDEILVREIYTPERLELLRGLEQVIKTSVKKFVSLRLPGSPQQKYKLNDILGKVRLELPPPASVYSDEKSLLTSDESFYYRSKIGGQKIRMGGALVDSVSSRYNLVFTLAHEMAHSISPCELKAFHLGLAPVQEFLTCTGQASPLVCREGSTLSEVFSDWVATQILVALIQKDLKQKKIQQKDLISVVVNSVRDLCPTSGEHVDEPSAARGLSSDHPSPRQRMNGIVAQHPVLRGLLGCQQEEPPEEAALVPPLCF